MAFMWSQGMVKVIRTKGLVNDLTKIEFDNANTITKAQTVAQDKISKMYYSFDKPLLSNLEVEVSYQFKSEEEVLILDRKMNLRRIEEIIVNEYLGWKAINIYWVDKNNTIWQSEQTISPKLPRIFIQLTKKPS